MLTQDTYLETNKRVVKGSSGGPQWTCVDTKSKGSMELTVLSTQHHSCLGVKTSFRKA